MDNPTHGFVHHPRLKEMPTGQ